MHPPNRRRQHPVNRRITRPSPARAVASRQGQHVRSGLRRFAGWLRTLPGAIHDALAGKPGPADSAAFGEPRTWDRQRATADRPADPATPTYRRLETARPAESGDPPHRRADTVRMSGSANIDHRLAAPSEPVIAARDDRPDDPDLDLDNLADPGLSAARSTVHGRPRDLPVPDFELPGDRDAAPPPVHTRRQPSLGDQAAVLGRRLNARAADFGRQLAPRAADFGRRLGPLASRGARVTGRGLRAAVRRLAELRPLLRLLRRFLAGVGELTLRLLALLTALLTVTRRGLVAGAVRHRALLFGLFTRAMWWGALVLLLLGGRALVEIHGRAPLDQQAFPAFAAGLALCALLVMVAAQARLRWAALVLGFSHGGLLALVWVVAAAIRH